MFYEETQISNRQEVSPPPVKFCSTVVSLCSNSCDICMKAKHQKQYFWWCFYTTLSFWWKLKWYVLKSFSHRDERWGLSKSSLPLGFYQRHPLETSHNQAYCFTFLFTCSKFTMVFIYHTCSWPISIVKKYQKVPQYCGTGTFDLDTHIVGD